VLLHTRVLGVEVPVINLDKNVELLIAEYEAALRALRLGNFRINLLGQPHPQVAGLQVEVLKLAQELERKFTEASKMRRIAEHVAAGVFLDDLLDRIYESLRSVIPYNRIGCALLSDDNQMVVSYWARSDSTEVKLLKGFTAPMKGSSLQVVLESGIPRIMNDLETYLAEHPHSISTKLMVAEGMRSSLTCPLVAQGHQVGFLFFSSVERNTYQDVHQDIYLQIAGQLSTLLEKSKLYQELHEVNAKLVLAQRELERKASHDELTDLYNRRAIIELLAAQLSRAKRGNRPFAVMMIDVDEFRQFNESYGHLAGDIVLKEVAATLSQQLRGYDFVGRYGGEEFLVLLSDSDRNLALETAERLRAAVCAKTIPFADKELSVTISVGVSIPDSFEQLDVDRLIAAADEALYTAKHRGRNRIAVVHGE
jgi:diguanylate cyclase (GGDEF)-like protein